MIRKFWSSTLVVLLAGSLMLAGCAAPKPAGLSDEQVGQVADAVLKAIDAGDYQGFGASFSGEMKAAFPENSFADLQSLLLKSSGKYLSCEAPAVSNNQGYAVYRFLCKYELEDVVVILTFKVDGGQVEGLFFDSVNLRKSSQ